MDAVIALNGILYCVQYTVSSLHTFNCKRFAASFWEQLPLEFRKSISNVIVDFVVPKGVDFHSVVVPESQRDLMLSRISFENGIDVMYRKAREGYDADGDESDDDDRMKEHDLDVSKDDEDDSDHFVDESFSDDHCGEEGFDDEEEMSPLNGVPPCIHFQTETLLGDFNVEKGPLKFLNLS